MLFLWQKLQLTSLFTSSTCDPNTAQPWRGQVPQEPCWYGSQRACWLFACFQNKETRSLEMLIYPFSQSLSLLMARKGKQTVKHLQGLVHPCTSTAAAGVEAAACGGGRAAVCMQTGCSCTGGLSSQFKCTDEIIGESGRIFDPGLCCAHRGCSELPVQPPLLAPEQQ